MSILDQGMRERVQIVCQRSSLVMFGLLYVLLSCYSVRLREEISGNHTNAPVVHIVQEQADTLSPRVPLRSKRPLVYYDCTLARWEYLSRLPKKRTLFMHMVNNAPGNVTMTDNHTGTRRNRTTFLYQSQPNSSVLFLVSRGAAQSIISALTNSSVQLSEQALSMTYYSGQALLGSLVRWFSATEDVEYFFQLIEAELPLAYRSNNRHPVSYCAWREWSFDYAFWSGAVVTYHLLHLPIIHVYDHVVRVDLSDIRYLKKLPKRFFEGQDVNCVAFHTEARNITCEIDIINGFRAFFEKAGAFPEFYPHKVDSVFKSISEWPEQKILYGNFVALQTHLLLDPYVIALADFLYEEYSQGYYEHRWADQGPTYAFIAYYLNSIDPLATGRVCDYSYLRGDFFVHSSKFKGDNPFI